MKYLIHSQSLPDTICSWFDQNHFCRFAIPPFHKLSDPTNSHPDMLLFPFGEYLLCHEDYYQQNDAHIVIDEIVKSCHFTLITTCQPIESDYPHDILFNALIIGSHLFGRLPYISKRIISACQRSGIRLVNIKQGYARCSCCVLNSNALMTADPSILQAAKDHHIETLAIEDEDIILHGLSKGFIGGASGVDNENVYFCGNIHSLSCADEIERFCSKHHKNIISLDDGPLTDYGGLMIIEKP